MERAFITVDAFSETSLVQSGSQKIITTFLAYSGLTSLFIFIILSVKIKKPKSRPPPEWMLSVSRDSTVCSGSLNK